MTKPLRIQLSRRKGFRLADAADNGLPTVKVDRTTKWGNQFKVDSTRMTAGDWVVYLCTDGKLAGPPVGFAPTKRAATELSVAKHREWLTGPRGASIRADLQHELRGKNLACWCGLCPEHQAGKPFDVDCPSCAPCHVDVLGPLANAPEGS